MSGIMLTLFVTSGAVDLVSDASFSGAPISDLAFGG